MTTKAIPIEQSEMEKGFRFDAYTNLLERKFRGVYWRLVKVKPNRLGYSIVRFNGKNILIHRLIYTLYHGNIDEGMHVDHYDGNPENNAISNLQLLSNQDNLAKSANGINPYFDERRGKYRVEAQAEVEGKNRHFYFKRFKEKDTAQLLCDTYNAKFGYGKPLYKARLGTLKEWREYMEEFRAEYI